jgi:threonine dehydratase
MRKPIHAVFCCVGGGGLICGRRRLHQASPAGDQNHRCRSRATPMPWRARWQAGKRVRLDHVGLFADGAAVKYVGEETFRLCQMYVDEMVLVNTDAICAAIKDVFEDTRAVLEPAGALAVAGAKAYAACAQAERHRTLVAIAIRRQPQLRPPALCRRTRRDSASSAKPFLRSPCRREPGAYKKFVVADRCAHNITEFNYRYNDQREAHVFVGIQVASRAESIKLLEQLHKHDYPALDLTDDEMAKGHIRHLVGGHSPRISNELLYRFEFPERPGALMKFLNSMSAGWNISLFHYRNHGADYGRVLVGMQVPPSEMNEFEDFLEKVGYAHWNETKNQAYKLFLG